MKNTLIMAALGAVTVSTAAPVLIYSTSFEEPGFSTTYNSGNPAAQLGFVGGQGATATNRPWGLPLFSSFDGAHQKITAITPRSGAQSYSFDALDFLVDSVNACRPIDSTVQPPSTLLGITSGYVVYQGYFRFNTNPSGNVALGLSIGEHPGTSFNTPQPEFGALVIGGNGRIYLRTGQATTIGTNLRLSSIPAVSPNTWHQLTLVVVPSSRAVFGYYNGNSVFGTNNSPTGVTASATTGSGSPTNREAGQLRLISHAYGTIASSVGVPSGGGYNTHFVDDVSAYKLDGFTVMVKAVKDGYAGATQGQSVKMQIRTAGSPTASTITTSYLDGDKVAASDGTGGAKDIWIKPKGALATLINNVTVNTFGTYFLGSNHVIGDIDEDNEIGPGDFDAVVAAFGSSDPDVDVDGDGEVGPSDFDLVVANFGQSGSPE